MTTPKSINDMTTTTTTATTTTATTTDWYPTFRPEHCLAEKQMLFLNRVLNDTKETESQEIDSLIRSLYTSAVTVAQISDHLHHIASENSSKLALAKERTTELERGIAEVGERQKPIMEQIVKQATESSQMIAFRGTLQSTTELSVVSWQREIDKHRKEIESMKKRQEIWTKTIETIRDYLVCPICCEVSIIPKVLGTCGHIVCQLCMKQLDDWVSHTLYQSAQPVEAKDRSARQLLLEKRCPMCRAEIIGNGFPVLPLKNMTLLLSENKLIDSIDEKKSLPEKEAPELQRLIPLLIGCWAQSQLAQDSVGGVLERIKESDWINGVYISFEFSVSRTFFDVFARTLHGKAGGLNVLVNTARHMLAVQLPSKKVLGAVVREHILVKVASDGRFVMTTFTI